jgi:hypothetical protein
VELRSWIVFMGAKEGEWGERKKDKGAGGGAGLKPGVIGSADFQFTGHADGVRGRMENSCS